MARQPRTDVLEAMEVHTLASAHPDALGDTS
jgi:hypothetical protein